MSGESKLLLETTGSGGGEVIDTLGCGGGGPKGTCENFITSL